MNSLNVIPELCASEKSKVDQPKKNSRIMKAVSSHLQEAWLMVLCVYSRGVGRPPGF